MKLERVVYRGTMLTLSDKFTDSLTWNGAYYRGYLEPRFPVPAHRYLVLITPHTVEIVKGIKKTMEGEYINYDCDDAFFATNYKE